MFGFGKKVEIKRLNIDEAHENFKNNPHQIVLLCVDEVKDYDSSHLSGAECLPLRLMDKMEEYYPDKELTYYVYAINKALSEKAYKKLIKQGYDVYDLGTSLEFRGLTEGRDVTRQRGKRRR